MRRQPDGLPVLAGYGGTGMLAPSGASLAYAVLGPPAAPAGPA